MAAEKAWLKAFNTGSKALQDRLRKVHAKNPEFQSFLGKHGFEGGSSVKQASKAQTVSKEVAAKRTELSNKAYGATTGAKVGGDHVELKDTIAPLTKDQHSKVQVAKKAALTKDERIAAIARASRKASSKYDIPTEDRDDAGHDDMMDLHHSLHIGHSSSLDEEAQKHRVNATISNPNSAAVTERDVQIQKIVRTPAKTPEEAVERVKAHFEKQGYKVHGAEHIGMVDSTPQKDPKVIAQIQKALERERKHDKPGQLTRSDDYTKKNYGKKDSLNYFSKKFGGYVEESQQVDEASMKGMPFTDAEKARLAKYDQADKISPLDDPKQVEAREKLKAVLADIKKKQPNHPATVNVKEEVELDEATKAYKDPITGQVTQIPAHKAPTYGFNKFGQFASLDRVPKPRKKLHNTAHQLMRTVDEFEEGSPERQAVTDALKKVVGAIKEAKDLSKDLKKRVELVTGGDKTLVRNKSGVLVARKAKKNVQEAHIDPNFVATFGVAAAAYDHVLNPLLKKAKQKVADKMAEKLGKKKEAPAQAVSEGSTTRGGFGGSADQAQHEIQWIQNKIETLKPLLTKKPSVARQIKDLERQARERELAIAYKKEEVEQIDEVSLAADIQRDVDARNKRLADAATKAKKKKAAEAKAASAAKQAKEMDKLKNLSKYGSDEEKEYAKGELQRIRGLEEASFKYDVDHIPGQTVRGTLPKSCPTCYGRKAMYKTPEGKLYADKKTEDSKRVDCPDCKGKGYVAEEYSQDSNYLNNKKNQIRESIQSKLAAKTGKNQ